MEKKRKLRNFGGLAIAFAAQVVLSGTVAAFYEAETGVTYRALPLRQPPGTTVVRAGIPWMITPTSTETSATIPVGGTAFLTKGMHTIKVKAEAGDIEITNVEIQ